MEILLTLVIIGLIGSSVSLFQNLKKVKELEQSLRENVEECKAHKSELEEQLNLARERISRLSKYEKIADIDKEAQRIQAEAQKREQAAEQVLREAKLAYDQQLEKAKQDMAEEVKQARAKAKEIREKADNILAGAHNLATEIEEKARDRAKEIAGSAYEAKENAEHYVETVQAMKNVIHGYGDEYLRPHQSLLDELADEYDHKEAGQKLAQIRNHVRAMIKNQDVAECDYVEEKRKRMAIAFVTDAFNGKVDSIMTSVKHNNYGKLEQKIKDSYSLVNHNGKAFRNAHIKQRFLEVILEQLKFAVATQELKRIDLEEQREIKAQMREEERARREYAKAIKEAEKEEKMLQKALQEARKRMEEARAEERDAFASQLQHLEEKLREAEARGERAMSMAQMTRQGHVYIISNEGSFGEQVFKIGLTRRLEPLDRVKELGDASVPFQFDIHAMIHAEDAPALERELQNCFTEQRLNKVNLRKEFFRIPISAIKERVEQLGHEVHWTLKAEAAEYHESKEIGRRLAERQKELLQA
jgi:Meiotically Up-regulated Gene 113 (MUG113) protein/uncharacterized protein DUF4041